MTSALSVQTPLVVEVPEEVSAAASADAAVSPFVVSAEANPATASPCGGGDRRTADQDAAPLHGLVQPVPTGPLVVVGGDGLVRVVVLGVSRHVE